MGTPCLRFVHLEARVATLINKFVADQIVDEQANPTSFNPDTDRLAAFRMLVHAELEDFLEQKAQEGLQTIALASARPDFHLTTRPDLLVLAWVLGKPLNINYPFDKPAFLLQVKELIKHAQDIISENNGIKEGSFFKLSLFSGKRVDEVEPTLASDLNSYGKDRGDVAHKSAARVRTINAPSTESRRATELVEAVRLFFYGPNPRPVRRRLRVVEARARTKAGKSSDTPFSLRKSQR